MLVGRHRVPTDERQALADCPSHVVDVLSNRVLVLIHDELHLTRDGSGRPGQRTTGNTDGQAILVRGFSLPACRPEVRF